MDTPPRHPAPTPVAYHGPAEHVAAWQRFVAAYVAAGPAADAERRTRDAALLDRLTFGDGLAEYVVLAARDMHQATCTRHSVEAVATFLSEQSQDKAKRGLHHMIVEHLAQRWVDAEKTHGLYPPPPQRTVVQRKVRDTLRGRFLRTPEGSLLSGVLMAAEESIIRAEARALTKGLRGTTPDRNPRVHAPDQQELVEFARARSLHAMFEYRPGLGALFTTFIQGHLGTYTFRSARRKHRRMARGPAHASDFVLERASSREHSPDHDAVMQDYYKVRLGPVLDRLPPRDRRILELRFGLNGSDPHTFEEVGNRLNISKQRAQQLEERILSDCSRLLSDTEAPESSGRGR